MRILLTGPSCSGKTCLARQFPAWIVQHLNKEGTAAYPAEGTDDREQVTIYEGISCGTAASVGEFLKRMDIVLVLNAPVLARLRRCLARDGMRGLSRWVYNEFCWRRYCRAGSIQTSRLSGMLVGALVLRSSESDFLGGSYGRKEETRFAPAIRWQGK